MSRRPAWCPLCHKQWVCTVKEGGEVVRTYDPVDVIADLIEREGCSKCYVKARLPKRGRPRKLQVVH